MRLILLGPPGAGKGTQAELVCVDHGLAHLSTGELLRAARDAGTPLGKEADTYMSRGELVPDELVSALVAERLQSLEDGAGFLLDGFPRNAAQAADLEGEPRGREIDHVVYLELDDDEVVRRLLGRGREDDTEAVIRNRLAVYARETEPLVELYRARGLLRPVDAASTIEEVHERIGAVLGAGSSNSAVGEARA